ncbi:hypothetical protein CLIB1423_06S04456 [[Candida] railenensis]|uniref:DUF7082 domain-containing protein n=1 Tax=[Candida] railenensis TaxID=45579 RepID=A0A9P0QP85_9ASCO|nr:hypothetical protein CLIB1423_06S04456 [[Candida] railenensis]
MATNANELVSAAPKALTSSAASLYPKAPEVNGAARVFDNSAYNNYHMPTMIRTSNVPVDFVRQNPQDAMLQVELLMNSDITDMTLNWTKQEKADQRRLVVFKFEKLSLTKFEIDFRSIKKNDFNPNLPIISCIYWKEQGFHIVTSVDIVVILEYLIQQSFSIEEKNRIRRNLQSLKPMTVSRNNKKFDRFFSMLMKMEDPRPRNIEKDIKVFKWNDLLNALEKVTSKYSPNLEHKANLKYIKQSPSNQAINIVSPDPNKARDRNIRKSHGEAGSKANETAAEPFPFLPNERLKVLKRKTNHGSSLNQIGTKRKNELFQHALKPTDPVPLKNAFEDKFKSKDIDPLKNVDFKRKEQVESTGEIAGNDNQIRSLLHEDRLESYTASPKSGSRKSVRLSIPSTAEYHIVSSPGSSSDELGSDSGNSGPSTKPASISSRSGHLYDALYNNKSSYSENITMTSSTSTDFKASAITPPYRALSTHDHQYPMKTSLYSGEERGGQQFSYGSQPLHTNIIQSHESSPYQLKNTVPVAYPANDNPMNVADKSVPTADLNLERKSFDNNEKPKLPTLSTLLPSLNLTSSAPPMTSAPKSYVPSPLPVYDSAGSYHLPPAQTPNNPSCKKFI